MSAIPDDIQREAAAALMATRWQMVPNDDFDHAVNIIAKAILAERQRCADVAQKEGDGYKESGLPQSAMGAYTTRRAILA